MLGCKGKLVTAGLGWGFIEGIWLEAPQFKKLCLYYEYKNAGASKSICS